MLLIETGFLFPSSLQSASHCKVISSLLSKPCNSKPNILEKQRAKHDWVTKSGSLSWQEYKCLRFSNTLTSSIPLWKMTVILIFSYYLHKIGNGALSIWKEFKETPSYYPASLCHNTVCFIYYFTELGFPKQAGW